MDSGCIAIIILGSIAAYFYFPFLRASVIEHYKHFLHRKDLGPFHQMGCNLYLCKVRRILDDASRRAIALRPGVKEEYLVPLVDASVAPIPHIWARVIIRRRSICIELEHSDRSTPSEDDSLDIFARYFQEEGRKVYATRPAEMPHDFEFHHL